MFHAHFPFLRPVPPSGGFKSPRLNTSLPVIWKFLAKVLGSGSGHIFPRSRDLLGPAAARPVKPLDYYSPLARQLSPSAASALFLAAGAAQL